MNNLKEEFGELLGTFILVFIGCGTVATATLFNIPDSLWKVACIWGIGVTIAIYSSLPFCSAHLNPAVSFYAFLQKQIPFKKLLSFSLFQLIGAFIAGNLLLLLFNDSIIAFNQPQKAASIFGEFFPNPGFPSISIDWIHAMLLEGFGTFGLLLVIIFASKGNKYAPVLIGIGLAILIYLIAPYTQAGFNPARDFGPRLIAYFSELEQFAFPATPYSFLTVYILAPLLGALLASLVKNAIFKHA